MAIVQKGISQVQEIIQRSNGELNSIGGEVSAASARSIERSEIRSSEP